MSGSHQDDVPTNSHHAPTPGAIEIDAGVRAWYASCRCCLSDAHPAVVAVLDAERDAAKEARADSGICETAEAGASHMLDPVCDMIVEVDEQRRVGLTTDYAAKTYAFCSAGCKRSFGDDPARYVPKVTAWEAAH